MIKMLRIPYILLLILLSACTQVNLPTFPSATTSPAPTSTATTTPTTPAPTAGSGIEGYVTIGPVCPGPVRIGDTACLDKPYQAQITILDANNLQVLQLQTDINGYFKVALQPGIYTLHPHSGKPFPISSDQTVTVAQDQYTQVSIQYDTGIR